MNITIFSGRGLLKANAAHGFVKTEQDVASVFGKEDGHSTWMRDGERGNLFFVYSGYGEMDER